MKLTLLYFAAARERAGLARESLELEPVGSVAELLERLYEARPSLAPLRAHLRVAVNHELFAVRSVSARLKL